MSSTRIDSATFRSRAFECVIPLEEEKRRVEYSFDQRLELFRRFLAWDPRKLTL